MKGLGYELFESPLLYNGESYELDFEDIEKKFKEGVVFTYYAAPIILWAESGRKRN